MQKTYIITVALALLSAAAARAQATIGRSVLASAGGSSTSGGYNMDWTVGEAVINSYTAGVYALNQGFHQGTTISLGIDSRHLDLVMEAYPNPVTDQLWLQVNQSKPVTLQAVITDINGKILVKEQLPANTVINHQFDMNAFPGGNYMLSVYRESQAVRTIKLIKR